MSIYSLYERIPSDWMALGIGCLAAWLYLKIKRRVRPTQSAGPVSDLLPDVFFAYVLFSRFAAGLIVGFDFNIKNDVLSMINGSVRYGWFIGVVAVAGYLSVKFYRHPELRSNDILRMATETFLIGGIFVFAFLSVISLYPFRMEAVVRDIGMILLFAAHIRSKNTKLHMTALVWIGTVAVLFSSSILIPQAVVWLWFTPSQWAYIVLLAAAYVVYTISYNRQAEPSTHYAGSIH